MKLWIGVTDNDWFDYLASRAPDEVNFWQPSGRRCAHSLEPGAPFLFKLHSPKNFIVGGGYFVRYTALPCSLAWDAFGEKNGVLSREEFLARIRHYLPGTAGRGMEPDPVIGCNILTSPFFFPQDQWISVPPDWARNIVQGKTYQTEEPIGRSLWEDVQARLLAAGLAPVDEAMEEGVRYGNEYLTRARLGQGTFRVLVTDAYLRRCAVTGERTLPVLEAAHIKPYNEAGPNLVQNGLLLRSDLHKLFDSGYMTITPELRVEVSRRIKEEYENGREYYAYHGHSLAVMPANTVERPSREFLLWHNEHRFAA